GICGGRDSHPSQEEVNDLLWAHSAPTCPVHTVIPLLYVSLSCRLWSCGLTETSCRDLAAVLRTSQSLTELDLREDFFPLCPTRMFLGD
uniref:Uncharacterized protein n=1 Tax=Chelonoidis abingdonii TaxID=106734 RepID=A0A8C0J147_CHEAB